MRIRFAIFIVFLSQLVISCKTETSDPLQEEEFLDVHYGTNKFNTVDIYLPAKHNGNTRTIIMVHGGYWYSGDKEDLEDYAEYFREEGFACAVINYRLTHTQDNYINPSQINDISKAIDFISSQASKYHISSSKFGLFGISSGAHLALLYSYSANSNDKIKTVVAVSAPSDFTKPQGFSPILTQVLTWFIGSTAIKDPGAYIQASPISHVNAASIPTYLIHGKLDNIVPYSQSVSLQAKLNGNKVKNQLDLVDGVGHDFTDPTVINSLLDRCSGWFADNIK